MKRLLIVFTIPAVLFGCSQPEEKTGQGYNVLSSHEGQQQAAKPKIPVRKVVAKPEFTVNRAIGLIKELCKSSKDIAVVAEKMDIRSAKSILSDLSDEFYTPDSEVYVASVEGDILWPFVDRIDMLNEQNMANFRGKKMSIVITPDNEQIIYAFLHRKHI